MRECNLAYSATTMPRAGTAILAKMMQGTGTGRDGTPDRSDRDGVAAADHGIIRQGGIDRPRPGERMRLDGRDFGWPAQNLGRHMFALGNRLIEQGRSRQIDTRD